jgi:hypothetical protein
MPVYYRVYSDGIAAEIKSHVSSDDPYLGRFSPVQIAPPHNAIQITRFLRRIERITDSQFVTLFSDFTSQQPLEDDFPVNIVGPAGPGSQPGLPIVLVTSSQPVGSEPKAGFDLKLEALVNKKSGDLYSRSPIESSLISPCSVDVEPGDLCYQKGDILYTNAIPVGKLKHLLYNLLRCKPFLDIQSIGVEILTTAISHKIAAPGYLGVRTAASL